MELFIFLGSLFFFMLIGVPLALVLVLCAIVLMWNSGMWDAMIIPGSMLDGANNYPLMAIPFFVFAGEIMPGIFAQNAFLKLCRYLPQHAF